MIGGLRQVLRKEPQTAAPAVPDGARVYAVGDIHGRRDLFGALARAIDEDDRQRGDADTTVILLGDLIDRGPDSAGVVEDAMRWGQERRVRVIGGNHEEMFLDGLDDLEVFRRFLRYGGRETILSYGVEPLQYYAASLDEAQAMARAALPDAHRTFLESLEPPVRIGDYLFAHAGIRPGVPVCDQRRLDVRWIREPFLSSAENHGCVVVHGHTISEDAVFRHNRIGIDTGAFRSGRLTALCLERTCRWLIEARSDAGGITTVTREAGGE